MQYTPFIVPLVLASLVLSVLAVVIWRRRPAPGVASFVVLTAAVGVWSLINAAALTAVDFHTKVFLTNLQFVGVTAAPAAWFAFSLEYTGHEKWLTRRTIRLLTIEPILTLLVAFTNGYHHLFHSRIVLDTTESFRVLDTAFGPAFWIHGVYTYGIMVVGTLFLIRAFIRSPHLYRGQVGMLLIAAFAPWIANAIYIFGLSPLPHVDLTPFAFTITVLALGTSIYRYRLMDIVPVARDTVIENMTDAVIVLDVQNRIVDANPAALRVLNRTSGVIGQPAADALSSFSDLVARYRDVQEARTEISLGGHNGAEERFFALRISSIYNRSGDPTGRLFVLHEITEIKRQGRFIQEQNDRLLEANRLKSEFLATMSHELRTPLNSVIGYADLMLTGLAGDMSVKQLDYIGRIMANGERLLALINDILDLSKIEAGRLEIMNRPFKPADLITGIQSRMFSLANEKGLVFDTYLDPDLPPDLIGDLRHLEQILTNLVGNAIRFTQSGRVEIRCESAGGAQWQIAVQDTGSGIPPHALEYIFDEFRQVDGSSQREHGGTGLGLAIVRKLATLMAGTVQVESELDKGSTFTVQLPLLVPDALAVEQ